MALKNFTQFTPQTVLSATDFVVGYRALDEIRTDLNSLTDAISGLLILKGFTPGGSLGSVRRVSFRYTIGSGSPVNAVSGVDDFGLTLSYTPSQIEVYRNGSHLIESLDFLATNSTQVTNLSTLNLGDIVEVVALSATGVTVIETLTGSGAIVQTNYRYTVPTSIGNGATTITGNDDFGASLNYTAPNLSVYLNGSHLVNSYDYTATNGLSIILNDPVTNGDVVDVQTLSSIGTGAVFGLSAFSGVSRIVAQNGVSTGSTGGVGIVTLSADIQGRTLKASPQAGDQIMLFDVVGNDNKKTTVSTLTSLAIAGSLPQLATAWYVLSSNASAAAFTLNRSYGISSIVYNLAGGGSGTSGNCLHWMVNYATPLSNRFVVVAGTTFADRGTTGSTVFVVTDQTNSEPTTYAMSTTGVRISVAVRGAAAVDSSHTATIFGT